VIFRSDEDEAAMLAGGPYAGMTAVAGELIGTKAEIERLLTGRNERLVFESDAPHRGVQIGDHGSQSNIFVGGTGFGVPDPDCRECHGNGKGGRCSSCPG